MVGVLLVSHGKIGQSFLDVAQEILGAMEQARAVSIGPGLFENRVSQEIERARKELDRGDGVLILTDMFGGSPCNICFSLLEDTQVEVLTGLNLSMLLKVLSTREGTSLGDLARVAQACGRDNICLGREILERNLAEDQTEGRK